MLSGYKQIKANNNNNNNKDKLVNPGFIRIKLIQLDPAPNDTVEKSLFCAVNIKQLIVKDDDKLTNLQSPPVQCDLMPHEYRKTSNKQIMKMLLPFYFWRIIIFIFQIQLYSFLYIH